MYFGYTCALHVGRNWLGLLIGVALTYATADAYAYNNPYCDKYFERICANCGNTNTVLFPGQRIYSQGYQLIMQSDGRLVLFGGDPANRYNSKAYWSAGTATPNGGYAKFFDTPDDPSNLELSIYNKFGMRLTTVNFDSYEGGAFIAHLAISEFGDIIWVRGNGTRAWHSNTRGITSQLCSANPIAPCRLLSEVTVFQKRTITSGGDYVGFYGDPNAEACGWRCANDTACVGFKFLEDDSDSAANYCVLRNTAPFLTVSDDTTTSGYIQGRAAMGQTTCP